ncbi:hypothetical protein COCOBI_16-3210 [Coccomyxa sp. Obi]|nr:hypothetical protein COCOBI_16-3210 [Coccomyxa sp. Obi]
MATIQVPIAITDPYQCLSINSAKYVSELAHKFGMQITLRMCDDFLVSKADADTLWGGDLNKAVGWLVWAEKYNLPKIAARARRYAVDNGGNVAMCPAAKQLSRESLLWLLDARYVDKEDMDFLVEEAEVPPGISPDDTYVLYRSFRGLPPL